MHIVQKFSVTIGIVFLSLCNKSFAQVEEANAALNELYKTYDSIPYITFDVKYIYSSDTLYGDFEYDILDGVHTLSGSRSYSKLGNIELVQNDSMMISVYHDDQMIVVSDPAYINTGKTLPLRNNIDSIFLSYLTMYTVATDINDSLGRIDFLRTDNMAPYKRLSVFYNNHDKLIDAIEYQFEDLQVLDSAIGGVSNFIREKILRVEFSNYRLDNYSERLFDESNYVFMVNGILKPVTRFRHFKVYNSKRIYR